MHFPRTFVEMGFQEKKRKTRGEGMTHKDIRQMRIKETEPNRNDSTVG